MCLCYLFSAKTAWQLVNRKADYLQNESIRIDSHNESNRIDSNSELECSTASASDQRQDVSAPRRSVVRLSVCLLAVLPRVLKTRLNRPGHRLGPDHGARISNGKGHFRAAVSMGART